MFEVRTLWAMNLLGGEMPGAVQGNQGGIVDGAKALQDSVCAQLLANAVIHRIERFGGNEVQHVPGLAHSGGDPGETTRAAPGRGIQEKGQ